MAFPQRVDNSANSVKVHGLCQIDANKRVRHYVLAQTPHSAASDMTIVWQIPMLGLG